MKYETLTGQQKILDPGFKQLMLMNINDLFKTPDAPVFHTRFMTRDICVHQDVPSIVKRDEFSIGPLHLRAKEKWDFESKPDWINMTVPAGTFQTIKSTLTFSGQNNMDTVDELSYSMRIGLVRWSQTSGGRVNWTAELSSYDFPK